ncbi:MerR family transcriptional regulator [Pedobacter yulinensis]|uniref:MerR family transcriptional regulator n=1 Tax=Pedobacter yulinensis TaxID=2126353 RepID=A0A2T3HLT2_9SPHI|nr:MerR family transcriptional regulator [Pedobacter yulinensis]PST83389.1 MerR family transcriptional regulator [Pedobacter yulinensis]
MNKQQYTVRQVSRLSGVSVRTLHLYDGNGLLKPALRSPSGYRLYGSAQLLRLQQILFYRELDVPLKAIARILDEPGFDLVAALNGHRKALSAKRARLGTLLKNIDNTIYKLKSKTMLSPEELYDGMPHDEAAAYRKGAVAAYGAEVVAHAERHLEKLSKDELKLLVARQKSLAAELSRLKHKDPADIQVQDLVEVHYHNTRQLWGTAGAADKQAEAYEGLGQLYLNDERFTLEQGGSDPAFRSFLSRAISIFVHTRLL